MFNCKFKNEELQIHGIKMPFAYTYQKLDLLPTLFTKHNYPDEKQQRYIASIFTTTLVLEARTSGLKPIFIKKSPV